MLPQHYILKQWSTDVKDEADMDMMISVELQGSFPKGKNSYFDVLYQEAVKCAEKGMASDHSFKDHTIVIYTCGGKIQANTKIQASILQS
ncbi:hypothetical protein WN944_005580 [Citrus x changshan-huyou]|uniref:Uncharacterized protein n=1 Tax=Citrus x changshan-huyou TaxID=2935761 RepID=A0AAP0M3I3_9ROSI